MTILFAMILSASAITPEKAVITTLTKVKQVQEKFFSDTQQFRSETEKFHELEFTPAVESMSALLSKGQCKKCLKIYLEALTYETNTADETIGDQLSKIIRDYPDQLNIACKQTPIESIKKIKPLFLEAFDILEYQQINTKVLKTKTISACLLSKTNK
jgi:hypothetical protein